MIIDKSKNNQAIQVFNKIAGEAIQKRITKDLIFSIEHKPSHAELGLQAADIFCWGINRKYHYQDLEWYNLFSKNIVLERVIGFKGIKKDGPYYTRPGHHSSNHTRGHSVPE